MKNLKLMSMLFMATAMCCGVSSCRDDDESKADDNISSTENEMDDAPSFGINVNGIEYRKMLRVGLFVYDSYEQGNTIELFYNPNNPNECKVKFFL